MIDHDGKKSYFPTGFPPLFSFVGDCFFILSRLKEEKQSILNDFSALHYQYTPSRRINSNKVTVGTPKWSATLGIFGFADG